MIKSINTVTVINDEIVDIETTKKDYGKMTDKEFIADQLTNAWEFNTPREMHEHLRNQTNVNDDKLKELINEWYKNDDRRNKILMAFGNGIMIFINEYV